MTNHRGEIVVKRSIVLAALITFASSALAANSKPTALESYLTHDLKMRDGTEEFLLAVKKRQDIETAFLPDKAFDAEGEVNAEAREALLKTFSKISAQNLAKIMFALGRTSYSNVMLIGEAGSGKTFLIDQLVTLLTFGLAPEFLEVPLGLRENESEFLNELRGAFFKNTQFLLINHSLLSLDNTKPGNAFAKSDSRMRSMIADLFKAAKTDFKEHKIRTVFIMEEVATLPELVLEALKPILDNTGFKTSASTKLEKGEEVGYSAIGITTPGEYREMIKADSANERRFEKILNLEPSNEDVMKILSSKRDALLGRYGFYVDDETLVYLLSMKSFFASPPLAMPDSVLKVLDGLFLWATRNPAFRKHGEQLTIDEAYHYLVEQNHLPAHAWLPTADGKPPLWNLQKRVEAHVVDQTPAVTQIVRRIKTGRATNFREVPVFIIMGPSGSGKNTIVQAINKEMFGHDGKHLAFDLSNSAEARMRAILESSGDQDLPLLALAAEDGPANGAVTFDEAKDMPSSSFDQLKTVVENATIRPTGVDKRPRPLGLKPIFIMGQWGEEIFKDKTDDEVAEIMKIMTQERLKEILKAGAGNGKGAVPAALIDRAVRTGGIVLLPPVKKSRYADVVAINAKRVVADLKTRSNLTVKIEPDIINFVAKTAAQQKMGLRALDGMLNDLTETAISEAYDLGLPLRGIKLKLNLKDDNSKVLVSHVNAEEKLIKEYELEIKDLLRANCAAFLTPKNETGQE